MNHEDKENKTLDYWIDKCPMFNDYLLKRHNVLIQKRTTTFGEIDDVYTYKDYVLIGENKCRDSKGCHKSKDKQIKKYKNHKNFLGRELNTFNKPMYFFYAHFENDELHVEYEGMKK